MKELFYHTTVDTREKRLYHVTVCLLRENGRVRARGISICSYLDQYSKRRGNTIARGRAHKAAVKGSSNPIRSSLQKVAPFKYKCECLLLDS